MSRGIGILLLQTGTSSVVEHTVRDREVKGFDSLVPETKTSA